MRDPLLERPEPSHRLDSFRPDATLSFAADGAHSLHVGERIPEDGIAVLGIFHDLVDGRDVMKALTRRIRNDRVSVFVIAGRPDIVSESFLRDVSYAQKVGGAPDVFAPSRELAVLLGVNIPRDGGRNRLRNGFLLVVDGAIVWRAIADAARPDTAHDTDGLTEAIAHYAK